MSTVVVLAGGKSRRMGRDKLELSLDGKTLLESAVSRFKQSFEHVYLSVADADKYPGIDVQRIVDIIPGAGPMSGLHAALTTLPDDGVFLAAADLPYANPIAAKHLIELCGKSDACAIRLPDGKLEPLFGYYRKSVLAHCESLISVGEYRMTVLLTDVSTRFADPCELGDLWDENLIVNVNYPKDFEKLLES